MRDSIMMYRSQCDAMRQLPAEQFKAVITALWDYELDGVEPSGDPIVTAMFLMAKPLIDKRNVHYENGKKGGRPKKREQTEDEKSETERKPKLTESEPEETVKDKGKRIKDKGKIKEYIDYASIIGYLNEKAGTAYRSSSRDTRGHINARFDDGYTMDDFKKVIDIKVAEWKGTDMEKYLRPSTLFGSKFESYLNQRNVKQKKTGFSNFDQRSYDFDELERQLLGVK